VFNEQTGYVSFLTKKFKLVYRVAREKGRKQLSRALDCASAKILWSILEICLRVATKMIDVALTARARNAYRNNDAIWPATKNVNNDQSNIR